MKKHKTTLIAAVAVGLLAASSSVAVAQDEAADSSVTFVSGLRTENVEADPGGFAEGDGFASIISNRYEQTIEWSDPRLPAKRVVVSNADMYQPLEAAAVPFASTVLLEGEAGSWTGTAVGYFEGAFGDFVGTNALIGHGAYEGLSAILYETPSETEEHVTSWEGIIIEGELPAMPDAIAAN